ncbi:MAG TPA: NAD(P)H-binding protein [Thermoleophilaceae bacterium]
MAGRIVLFGATGYTGRLTADAMVERGLRPVLAARGREKLDAMASELGGLEVAVADVADPSSVKALVEKGDVLVTTVGPFVRFGSAAAAGAATAGAHYLDSTGEPLFIRQVFERYGLVADRSGCGMITAFGYDFVPGNLAGAIALERAGQDAVRVDTGYFFTGAADAGAMSGGTRASLLGALTAPGFVYRDDRVHTERGAKRYRTFPVGGKRLGAVSVGTSEHFALPRLAPQLREVNAYLGWFGSASRAMQVMSAGSSAAMKLPGAERLVSSLSERFAPGSTGGPDEQTRAKSGSHIVAIAYDAAGRPLAEVHVTGVDGYTFTGRLLAWGAERAAAGGLKGTGALGPVDAFGLDELRDGCAQAGMGEDGAPTPAAAEKATAAAGG